MKSAVIDLSRAVVLEKRAVGDTGNLEVRHLCRVSRVATNHQTLVVCVSSLVVAFVTEACRHRIDSNRAGPGAPVPLPKPSVAPCAWKLNVVVD